jgi:hypothetical protein
VAGGSTLVALTTTVAAGSPAAPAATTSTADTVSLPADLLLKPKAPNCASLASGSFRVIKLAPSTGNTVTAVDTVDFDAPTLTMTVPGSPGSTVWTANGNCRYSTPDGADVVVSPAGVLVARANIGLDDTSVAPAARGTTRMVIGLPVQSIAVADLAGNWNAIGWERADSTLLLAASSITAAIASNGAVTQAKCGDLALPEASCPIATTGLPVFSANAAGGFNLTSTDPQDPYTDRAYAYRAGNGALMVMLLSAFGGDFDFLIKAQPLNLPAVGAATANYNVEVRVTGLASNPVYYRNNSIASVNSAAGTVLRNATTNGSAVAVPETLEYNKARDGYFHRPAATATASDGSTVTVRENWVMPLRGFGISPYALPATSGSGASSNAIFGVSVAKQP